MSPRSRYTLENLAYAQILYLWPMLLSCHENSEFQRLSVPPLRHSGLGEVASYSSAHSTDIKIRPYCPSSIQMNMFSSKKQLSSSLVIYTVSYGLPLAPTDKRIGDRSTQFITGYTIVLLCTSSSATKWLLNVLLLLNCPLGRMDEEDKQYSWEVDYERTWQVYASLCQISLCPLCMGVVCFTNSQCPNSVMHSHYTVCLLLLMLCDGCQILFVCAVERVFVG